MHIDGRCHCGFITYEAEVDPAKVSICHCTDCQTLTGSAYRVTVPAPKDSFRLLSDTRTAKDTLDVFGGEYPGGALYTKSAWIASHPKETQALTNAILATLKWIHSHTPEEIMAKMPDELVGPDKALYLAALKNTIPMYSQTGLMDPKGADAVLAVFSEGSPEVAKANIELSKTWTNKYVEQVKKTTGAGPK